MTRNQNSVTRDSGRSQSLRINPRARIDYEDEDDDEDDEEGKKTTIWGGLLPLLYGLHPIVAQTT